MSRRRTDSPAPSTLRGRRHTARRREGCGVYRVIIGEQQLTTLVRTGWITDHQSTDQAAVERALTALLANLLNASCQ